MTQPKIEFTTYVEDRKDRGQITQCSFPEPKELIEEDTERLGGSNWAHDPRTGSKRLIRQILREWQGRGHFGALQRLEAVVVFIEGI